MKILHTSDWHLGRRLCGQERREEFEKFLDWLAELIEKESPDALVVAGDIFDTYTPPTWAQRLYFQFLKKLLKTDCRSVVVVSGNHDSPALIDMPRDVLALLNVSVVGEARSAEEEVVELPDASGETGALCCAVPFLRANDLRGVMAGETPEAVKDAELEGFRAHYAKVSEAAEALRGGRDIPIIATGHCFVAGGKVRDDDGVRDLSVGSIDAVPTDVFPKKVDYLALGHLHMAQKCGEKDSFRYSGAPLCMGFGEAGQQKNVLIVEFEGRVPTVRAIPVPEFQKIVRLRGSYDDIASGLSELVFCAEPVFVEADCTDNEQGLNDRIRRLVPEDSPVKILRVKAEKAVDAEVFSGAGDLMDDWTPKEIFKRYLQENDIDGSDAEELMSIYLEMVQAVLEQRGKGNEDM